MAEEQEDALQMLAAVVGLEGFNSEDDKLERHSGSSSNEFESPPALKQGSRRKRTRSSKYAELLGTNSSEDKPKPQSLSQKPIGKRRAAKKKPLADTDDHDQDNGNRAMLFRPLWRILVNSQNRHPKH